MQLRAARLCLDCEEVHDAQQCPACASEAFAYLTRWVPSPERGALRPRVPQAPDAEVLGTYREMLQPGRPPRRTWTMIRRGAVGVALLGLAGWVWRRNHPADSAAGSGREGEAGSPPI
jgi:hypothetical protein